MLEILYSSYVTTMLSMRVLTQLSVLFYFVGLSQQKYFLIDTEAEEGSGLGQEKINSTYPTEGPAKLKLYNPQLATMSSQARW